MDVRNKLKLVKSVSLVVCLIFGCYQTLWASGQGMQASVFAGGSFARVSTGLLAISPAQVDELISVHTSTNSTVGVGLAYPFDVNQLFPNNTMLQQILLGVNFFHYNTQNRGNIEEYGATQFTNYHYYLDLKTDRVMADIQLVLQSIGQGFTPFVNGSIGGARVKVHYYEMPKSSQMITDGELNLAPNTTNKLAYSLGAGLKKSLTSNVSLAGSYLYSHFGSVATTVASNQATNNPMMIESPLMVRLSTHSVLLALIYTVA